MEIICDKINKKMLGGGTMFDLLIVAIGILSGLLLFFNIPIIKKDKTEEEKSKNEALKISVIIPCRNEESNIGELLGALSIQTYPIFEIICVDDISEDKTAEIISAKNAKLISITKHPDGAKHFKGDFTKKHLLSTKSEYLAKFVRESCRAELVHYLGMIPFVIFFLLVPPLVASILVIYSILVNLPCIIAQRYNRPRLIQLYKLTKQREEKSLVPNNEENYCI